MKVLTIRQPWAWAIARGHKDIENRRWTTRHRGPLAIHAGGAVAEDMRGALKTIRAHVDPALLPRPLGPDDPPYSLLGRIVAVVDLVDVCTASLEGRTCRCGRWAMPGQAHWRLAGALAVAGPILPGRLGLWEYDLTLPDGDR